MDNRPTANATDQVKAPTDNTNGASPFNAHELLAESPKVTAQYEQSSTADTYLPTVVFDDFNARAEKVLKNVSVNADGTINPQDLVKVIEDPSVAGLDAVVAATAYYEYKQSPETFRKDEISHLRVPTDHDVADFLRLNDLSHEWTFNSFDKDKNGLLSVKELNKQSIYKDIVDNVPDLGAKFAASPQGLTMRDFDESKESLYKEMSVSDKSIYYSGKFLNRLSNATERSLYNLDNPTGGISAGDVVQGTSGDCYFMAVLSAAANAQPGLIRDAIKDNVDNTFTVTFKGDPANPVTIDVPTDAELALYASTGKNGIWPAVMEKAFAKYSVEHLERKIENNTAQDAISGGFDHDVMALLTGHEIRGVFEAKGIFDADEYSYEGKPMAISEIHLLVQNALKDGRLVSVSVLGDADNAHLIERHHAYPVLNYSPGVHGGSYVLRDPRGPNNDGEQYIRLSEKDVNRSRLTFKVETDEPMKLQ